LPSTKNDPQFGVRRWRAPKDVDSNPGADATIDHPAPQGMWIEVDNVPLLLAPDPGGVLPRAGSLEFLVEAPATPVQHSPITNWSPGTPYPGPPARVWGDYHTADYDSIRWWGKTGQGRLVWSEQTEFSGDLPPMIPFDMPQHLDNFQGFWGGYAPIARNRPTAFGDQVAVLNPLAQGTQLSYFNSGLPEG